MRNVLFGEVKTMSEKKTEDVLKCTECDPFGSYTGVVTDEFGFPVFEEPVQDADDL